MAFLFGIAGLGVFYFLLRWLTEFVEAILEEFDKKGHNK